MSKISKWIESFLEFKNEASATRKFALFAVAIITVGLISLAVTGVISTATWSAVSFLPAVGTIIAIFGSEMLATVAFIRAMQAPTLKRKIAGYVIFVGLAAVGVHNAERGAHVVWPGLYETSSGELAAKANLAGEEAALMGKAAEVAVSSSGDELERVRTEIAELKTEQQLMASQSPEGIEKAQALLMAQGLYFGKTDGIRRDLTESAMRARGEAIQRELAVLKQREDGFMTGVTSPVQAATSDKRLLEIETQARAEAVAWAGFWLLLMLWTWEGARSLGLWALVTDVMGKDVQRDRDRQSELDEEAHQNALAELRAKRVKSEITPPIVDNPPQVSDNLPPPSPEPAPEPIPEPVEAVSEPEAPAEPHAPLFTDAQHRARNAGLAGGQYKAAARAKQGRVILVGDWLERDQADREAAKEAAQ